MKLTKIIFESERDEYKNVFVYIYPTLKSIYQSFLGKDLKGKVIRSYVNFKFVEIPVKEAMKNSREYGCWGFTGADDRRLHIWFKPDVNIFQLISMLSHEAGHIAKPHHRELEKEEAKAQQYQDVTNLAIGLAHNLLNNKYIHVQTLLKIGKK